MISGKTEKSHAPPPPIGAGLAQGGLLSGKAGAGLVIFRVGIFRYGNKTLNGFFPVVRDKSGRTGPDCASKED